MKITDIRAVGLSAPVPKGKIRTDFGTKLKSDTTIVVVETDAGLTGYGCADGPAPLIQSVIDEELKHLLLGEDPSWVERLWEKMYSGNRGEPALLAGHSQPYLLGRRGIVMGAISGIDIALWDVFGKSVNLPVYKLLGACRDRIRGYASGGWQPEATAAQEISGYVAKGFTAVKMRAYGLDGFSIPKCVARVKAVRNAIGPDVGLMVDAHGALDPVTALKLAQRLAEFDLTWFEEPVSPDEHGAMAEIRARGGVPIAAGESEFTRWAFRDLIAAGAVDYIQPDVVTAGGITELRRIAAIGSAHGKFFAPHNWYSAVAYAASLHLACSIPSCRFLEVNQSNTPLVQELTTEPFKVENGFVVVSDKPGLGIELVDGWETRWPHVPGPMFVY